MLKILGCFKIVPDYELLSEEDWVADEHNLVDASFAKTIWNCFDESALEMMLRLSAGANGLGREAWLSAVTVGGIICDNYLKTLYALGYKSAARIECEEAILFRPQLTAGLIAEYVSRIDGQQLVIMGKESADTLNGKVPLLMAEILGWPCVTQVTEADLLPDCAKIRVKNIEDGGSCTRTVKLPCVLAVGDAPCSYLRIPTLKERMSKGKKEVAYYNMWEFAAVIKKQKEDTKLIKTEAVIQKRAGVIINGDTPKEKAEILYHSYLKERLRKK